MGITIMRLPGDQSRREESFRCPTGSSAYSSFYSTEPSVSPSEYHEYSPFFQAPLSHGPNPMPHLAPTYCSPNGHGSCMTMIPTNETYGKHLQTSHNSGNYTHRTSRLPLAPHTEDVPHDNERFQQPEEEHHCAKYKNLHGDRDSKKIDACGPFRCKWINCRYPGLFARKAVLMRHIETQHVTPRSFGCPDKECDRSFNRKDNMEEHWRRVHRAHVLNTTNLVEHPH